MPKITFHHPEGVVRVDWPVVPASRDRVTLYLTEDKIDYRPFDFVVLSRHFLCRGYDFSLEQIDVYVEPAA